MNARLERQPSKEWAALRVWAAAVRDNDKLSSIIRTKATSLISLLNAQYDCAAWNPTLAESLWSSCVLMAKEIAKPPDQQARQSA